MSTTGDDDSGDGSFSNPYLTLMKCQEMANEGDTVYIMEGTYTNFDISSYTSTYNYIFTFNKSFITYKVYNSKKAIFDFEYLDKYKTNSSGVISQRVTGFYIQNGIQNITFEDIICTHLPTMSFDEVSLLGGKNLTQSECFQSRGKYIRFNRCSAYSNYGIGFYFAGLNSYNIAYRCDSYNNSGYDKASKGNADGFGAHGTGAEFIECRAWDNSDDNYDCIESYGSNIFDGCWSFRINFTGSDIQDGNGFKVGGWGKSATAKEKYYPYSGDNPPLHIVKNCIAAYNKAYGFYSNHQPGQAAVWYNNRAYNNKANFDMIEGSESWELDSSGKVIDICGTREVLFFNIAHKYSSKLTNTDSMYGIEGNLYEANLTDEKNQFNSWNFRNIQMADDDFLSLDWNELAGERGEDGSLPEINFLKLNPSGTNYALLKTIEEEMKNYQLFNNGTIAKLTSDDTSTDDTSSDDTSSDNTNNDDTSTDDTSSDDTSSDKTNNDDTSTDDTNNDNSSSDKTNNDDTNNDKTNNNNTNNDNTSSDNTNNDNTNSDTNSDNTISDNTNSNENNKSKKSGLSPGIIVGIVLGVIAVGVGIFLFLYYRRKNKKKEEDNMISNYENHKKDNNYRMDLEMENEDITKQKNVHSDSDILSINNLKSPVN